MNKGTYGYPLPPNAPTRVAPPEWRRYFAFTSAGTYSNIIVPQNVYQVCVAVFGPGGGGGAGDNGNGSSGGGGGGGGFAFGIIDVTPGQILPTIIVGAGGLGAASTGMAGSAGGTSSFGTLLSATSGGGGGVGPSSGRAGGTGSASSSLRGSFTASGGRGGHGSGPGRGGAALGGGGAPGSVFGNGQRGLGFELSYENSTGGSLASVLSNTVGPLDLLDLLNGVVRPVWTGSVPIGRGAAAGLRAYFSGMGGSTSAPGNTAKNHFGGGGGGAGYDNGGFSGGDGAVIIGYSEGY